MASAEPQTFANRARLVPGYHFPTFGLLLINIGWSVYCLVELPSVDAAVMLGVAIALGFLLSMPGPFHSRFRNVSSGSRSGSAWSMSYQADHLRA
jgi:hypothetical protein